MKRSLSTAAILCSVTPSAFADSLNQDIIAFAALERILEKAYQETQKFTSIYSAQVGAYENWNFWCNGEQKLSERASEIVLKISVSLRSTISKDQILNWVLEGGSQAAGRKQCDKAPSVSQDEFVKALSSQQNLIALIDYKDELYLRVLAGIKLETD